MLEPSAGEKTLPPSPLKRQRAREEGKVARSQDLCAGFALLVALFGLRYFGLPMFQHLESTFGYFFENAHQMLPDLNNVQNLAFVSLWMMAPATLPFMITMLIGGLVINVLQVGLLFTGKPLTPDFTKINPFSGFANLFSLRALVELVKSVFKVGIVVYVSWITVRDTAPDYVRLMNLTPLALVSAVGGMAFILWWRIALALLVLGLLDYGFQRWQYERSLMMTVQEAREELKEYEGDPRIKQRIRQIQRRIAMQRMMAEVPRADVVITNPIQFAIVIRYDAARMSAPVVVAKGARLLAERIRNIAVEHDVPIVQKPDLARSLFRTVEAGQAIPEPLFRAVAEVLAYVYQIDRRIEKIREREAAWRAAPQAV
jgi:flagellar biosynthetic protein FlhB